jgi:APA family basic amino acid/polyamine antiporter
MAECVTGLKRHLKFHHVVLAGTGMTIGAGIFAVLGVAAGRAGDAVWLSFFIAGIAAILTGLSYAELASMFPKAGAEFEYISHAIGERAGVLIGCVIIVSCTIGAAMVIASCADYASSLSGLPPYMISICILPLFLCILLRGVMDTARFVILLTVAEAGCLLLLIIVSLPYAGSHPAFEMPEGLAGVFSAAAMVFVAYAGFEGIVKLSEETFEPERVIPRALLIVLTFVTLLYAAAAYGAASVVGWAALSASSTPVTLVFETALHTNSAPFVSAVIVLGTANSAIMVVFAASRVLYSMACRGIFPKSLSCVSPARNVPANATAAVLLCVFPFAVLGNLAFLADLTSLFFIISYLVINTGVVMLRIRDPGRPRPFRIPGSVRNIPVSACLGAAISLGLILLLSQAALLTGLVIICTLSLIVHFRMRANA